MAVLMLLSLAFSSLLLVFPQIASAEDVTPMTTTQNSDNVLTNKLKIVAGKAGFAEADSTTLRKIFGALISAFLSILGILFLVYMLYAGYTYMVAHGEEEKVKKSLATIRQAIIGLCIVIGAYAIWAFFASYIIK